MRKLYVLYDGRCELCRRLQEWLLRQDAWLELQVLPANSPRAGALFPGLERIASAEDLAVVSDEGGVYLNNRAWIMCLYALREYRGWANRLSHPLLEPLARQAFASLSRNRLAISRWMASSNPEIAEQLRQVTLEPCSTGPGPEPRITEYLR